MLDLLRADLVVEVLSDSTRNRDEGIKLERYELLGVQEYWVVDPKRNEARIYRRTGERLQQVAELTAAARDVLTSPFFPGLEIPASLARTCKSSPQTASSEPMRSRCSVLELRR